MADYCCLLCSKPFKRRGKRVPKYCSPQCQYAARPPSRFDMREWLRNNRERKNRLSREWAAANRGKRQAIQARRRAASRGGAAPDEMLSIMAAAAGRCTYCGEPSEALEFDHVVALTTGGNSAANNLLPACRSCNASKGNRAPEDWIFDRFGLEGLCRAISALEVRS